MKASLSEQLKELKFNLHEYGRLPLRERVFWPGFRDEQAAAMQKQWQKLNIVRKNLKILEKYITSQSVKPIHAWANETGDEGLSHIVLDKIGKFNNETGGISMYFLNLQHFYDAEEVMYDKIEAAIKMPEVTAGKKNMRKEFEDMRKEREEKRKLRLKSRKLKIKGLKKDDKGYIKIELEEPKRVERMAAADGSEGGTPSDSKEGDGKSKPEKIKSNIGVWLAGSLITITVISIVASLASKNSK